VPSRTADEWDRALLTTPAAVATCRTLEEWLGHEQVRANRLLTPTDDPFLGTVPLVAPPLRVVGGGPGRPSSRRHGSQGGALAGHRVVDMASFWAGPLASRLLAELGADVVKVEPPGGEGAFQLMPALPNIYLDANRSKRGFTLDLRDDRDRRRLLDLVEVADVVVENAVAGTWEQLELDEGPLRKANQDIVYARAKGFGLDGPLASRPSFDYVVQAATGMEMTQGGGRPQPVNFTANDYGTGLHLAAGIVLALLARARGTSVRTVEASLMMTATVFQSEHVAQLAGGGGRTDDVGPDLAGPSPWCRLYQGTDGWVTVCAVTPDHRAALVSSLGAGTGGTPTVTASIAAAIGRLGVGDVCARLGGRGVPVAVSAHPAVVPDDPQVRANQLLITVGHPVAGPFIQVGVPVHLSADGPAVKGPAPSPARRRSSRSNSPKDSRKGDDRTGGTRAEHHQAVSP
jgi:formyl-CoA transferase